MSAFLADPIYPWVTHHLYPLFETHPLPGDAPDMKGQNALKKSLIILAEKPVPPSISDNWGIMS